jgi:hypothetical protein
MGRHASQAPRQVGSGPCLVPVASRPPGYSRAWAGSQIAFSPLKDGDGERGAAEVSLADVDRRRQQLCRRFGRQSTAHGSVDRPGGIEGASARRCALAVVVNTGSHTSHSEVSSWIRSRHLF